MLPRVWDRETLLRSVSWLLRIPVKWGTDSGACGAASERSDAGYGHDLKVPHISQDFLHF